MSDFEDEQLEHELQEELEKRDNATGSRETPVVIDSSEGEFYPDDDRGDGDDGDGDDEDDDVDNDDSDLEVLEETPVAKARRVLVVDDDMDTEQVEEIMLDTEPEDLEHRKGFKSFQCPVCMDPPDTVLVTPCGHMYCTDCGVRALSSTAKATDKKGECSICRRRIDYKQIKYLEIKVQN